MSTRNKKIQFFVNEREYEVLKNEAEKQDISMSELLRDFVKSLMKNR